MNGSHVIDVALYMKISVMISFYYGNLYFQILVVAFLIFLSVLIFLPDTVELQWLEH